MSVAVTVLYPNESDATFNMDYYLNNHMPMVQGKFAPHGMKGWRVTKLHGGPDGSAAKYSVCCTLEFSSMEETQAAFAAEAGPVMADISNFSNKEPVIGVGEEVGSHPK